jgi:site-specific DNA-cytosine methylase
MDNNGEVFATVLMTHEVVGTLQSRDAKGLNHEGARDGKAVIVQAYDESNKSISEVHHTLRSGTSQSTGVRRLTPLECERLQGFPDNWTEGQADSNRYKQTGNAVAVPVAEWIIRRLLAVDEANLAHSAFCTELQVLYGETCACQERQ